MTFAGESLYGSSVEPPGAGGWAKRVSICFCSCRRLDLLKQAVTSVREGLPESREVEVVVIDDNSSAAERAQMLLALPGATLMFKSPNQAGHARSLNLMLRSLATEYVLYWEDDMALRSPGPWLARAVAILDSNPDLVSVSFDSRVMTDANSTAARAWRPVGPPHEHSVFLPGPLDGYVPRERFRYEQDPWPGFSLLPNLLARRRAVDRVGFFREDDLHHMEYDFGLRCLKAGLLTAVLQGCAIEYLPGTSAYVLNGTPRYWDLA